MDVVLVFLGWWLLAALLLAFRLPDALPFIALWLLPAAYFTGGGSALSEGQTLGKRAQVAVLTHRTASGGRRERSHG